jgi:hypothetical protein
VPADRPWNFAALPGQAAILIPVLVFTQPLVAAHQVQTPGTTPSSATETFSSGTVSADRSERPRSVTPGMWARVHLPDPVGRHDAQKALDLAWEKLGQADCANVLRAFSDSSGRPLALRLGALSVDVQTYLTMLVFIDGSRETPCVSGVFAFTTPGSRVIRICVDELKRTWLQDREHAAASFIHEMLHTLGLGENPPSSAEVTRRVSAACDRRR